MTIPEPVATTPVPASEDNSFTSMAAHPPQPAFFTPNVGTTATANKLEPVTNAETAGEYWKPLNFCDLMMSRPFSVLAQNWQSFLTIALLASGLRALLAFVFDVANGPDYGADYGAEVDYSNSYGEEDYEQSDQPMDAATLTMSLVNSLILFVATCLADGASIQVVANIYAGQPSLSAVMAVGIVAEKSLPLVGSCLLVFFMLYAVVLVSLVIFLTILVMAGAGENFVGPYIILMSGVFAFALYISMVTYLMYPAIIVENKGMVDSIRRSAQLTQGYLGKILAILVVYGSIKMALGVVILAVTISSTTAALVMRGLLSFGVNTFFIAIGAILKAVIYFDIRSKTEEMGKETLKQEMGLSSNGYATMEDGNEKAAKDAKAGELV